MPKTLPLSYVELSKAALVHNLKQIRSLAKPGTGLAFPVKGNAYGHGLAEIVSIAEKHVDYFLVNSIEELRVVRATAGSTVPVLLFGYVAPEFLGEAISLCATLGIFSLEQLKNVNAAARKMHARASVHLACDAHLGREGFLEGDFSEALALVPSMKNVFVSGMYAHFANIEDTSDFSHAQKQIDAFERMKSMAIGAGLDDIKTHISATSGLFAYESKQGSNTIVRTGIGAYGLWPSENLKKKMKNVSLLPVLSWKTRVAQVKELEKGSTVGYGLTYTAPKKISVALIPQGYSDGFPRSLSNKGKVLIGGVLCPILGRVAMNMCVADVSRVPDVTEGDEVVILGSQGSKKITAEDSADLSGTINYEAVTRISSLLPRIIK